ncbi:hypothetical protein ACQE3E_13110 [Methylomonas sp. MED-D]|uniref:hypothetical protein n=1 Tax=Methylomonas sp. MED-D TaxID=3418768 RepID=UPI003CFDF343
MNALEQIQMLQWLLVDINSILEKHSISPILLEDITVTDSTVSDNVKQGERLSSSIINKIWPSVENATVFHYTSKDKAESILNSGKIRLYTILKRYTDNEISAFCEAHSLNGYLEKDEHGQEKYKTLIMPNTFYSSFTTTTGTTEQEEYFWRNFAAIDGVRLKIEVSASNPDFRRIVYPRKDGEPLALLSELTTIIREKYKREFILTGISPLCAFFLLKNTKLSLSLECYIDTGVMDQSQKAMETSTLSKFLWVK